MAFVLITTMAAQVYDKWCDEGWQTEPYTMSDMINLLLYIKWSVYYYILNDRSTIIY